MTAVAVELLTSPPEAADVPAGRHAERTRARCCRVRCRYRYPAHDVLVQREQQPAVLRLSTARPDGGPGITSGPPWT